MNGNKSLLDRRAHRSAQGHRRTHARAIACTLICATAALTAHATVTNTWNVDAPGNWSDVANWANANIPTNAGDVANLTYAISVGRTVTVNLPVKLGALKVGGINKAYTLATSGSGSITMDNGSDYATMEQPSGSAQNILTPAAAIQLDSDLDLVNASGSYMNIGPFSGQRDIHVNRAGAGGTPYMNQVSPNFYGNVYIYSGRLMWAGEPFGNTTVGTRLITIYNNATLRDNGNSLGANRRIIVGSGGATLALNGKTLSLNNTNQLAGSEALSFITEAGTFGLYAANDFFTGPLTVGSGTTITNTLVLGNLGTINSAPLIHLATARAFLDVAGKTAGYNVPAGQVVAGIGTVLGRINVSTAGAKIHAGSYTLPGPVTNPGKLTITNGLAMASGGAYLWDLKTLKDDALGGVAGTDFGTLDVTAGAVSLSGGVLTLSFVGVAGTSGPNSGNAFWKTEHTWTILSATTPPTGILTVSNGVYTDGEFWTQVSGNALQLVYGRPIRATTILVR